jgi:Ca2+-binding RTX toxin-like protein
MYRFSVTVLLGMSGRGYVRGNNGNDDITGSSGKDELHGDDGNDSLRACRKRLHLGGGRQRFARWWRW